MAIMRRLALLAAAVVAALLLMRGDTLVGRAQVVPPPGVITQSFSIQAGGFTNTVLGVHPADILTAGPTVAIPCPALGLICTDFFTGTDDDLNSLSYGLDYSFAPDLPPVEFSVAAGSSGMAGTAVRIEALCATAEPQADAFETGLAGTNAQDLDGDGAACGANAGFPIGLCEVACGAPADDLDALDQNPALVDTNSDGVPDNLVYFTLTPASPSLTDPAIDATDPALDARAADILATVFGFTPFVWADGATNLGLNETGGDVIDAICVGENGSGVFDAADSVLFSLAPGSPSLIALGAGAADLLRPGPFIVYPASRLGLDSTDNLDAVKCPTTDADHDLFFDIADNCPNTANPGQEDIVHPNGIGDACDNPDGDGQMDSVDGCPDTFTVWRTPMGDADCDGFTTARETFMGTNAGLACGVNAWPVDNNDDHKAALADILRYIPVFGTSAPPPPSAYNMRFDLNTDNKIGLTDILMYIPFFNITCTP